MKTEKAEQRGKQMRRKKNEKGWEVKERKGRGREKKGLKGK